MGIFNVSPMKTAQVFSALRAHMNPSMRNQGDYGFFPCALAHNAQVICVHPCPTDTNLNVLAHRSAMANYVRNDWVVTKRCWYTVDAMRGDCGYLEPFIMPMMRNKFVKEADYSGKTEKIKLYDVRDIDIPLGMAIHFKDRSKPQPISQTVLFNNVVSEMVRSQQADVFVEQMILDWEGKSNFASALAWRDHSGRSCTELCDMLIARSVKNKDKIMAGIKRAQDRLKEDDDDDQQDNDQESEEERKNVDELPPLRSGDNPEEDEEDMGSPFGENADIGEPNVENIVERKDNYLDDI